MPVVRVCTRMYGRALACARAKVHVRAGVYVCARLYVCVHVCIRVYFGGCAPACARSYVRVCMGVTCARACVCA